MVVNTVLAAAAVHSEERGGAVIYQAGDLVSVT